MAARALAQLDAAPLTEPGSLVIVQIHPRERGELDGLTMGRLVRRDERKYGSTLLLFYEHVAVEDSASAAKGSGDDEHTL
jgi:hypothetical protein